MKKIFVFTLCLALLFSANDSGMILLATAENSTVDEKKVYCNASANDVFAEDTILVVLNNAASLENIQYESADFSEINPKEVHDLSQAKGTRIKKMLEARKKTPLIERILSKDPNADEISSYQQVLCITLAEKGKQAVLAAIELLEQREDILYVGPDYIITGLSDDTIESPLDEYSTQKDVIDLTEAQAMVANSETVVIGVLDSGIDAEHPDLSGKVDPELSDNFVYYESGNTCENTISSLSDPLGHGTHVAGIICSVAENVQLISLRVLDSNNLGKSSFLIAALEHVKECGEREENAVIIPILNFSGGWQVNHAEPINDPLYDMPVYDSIYQYCYQGVHKGLFICGAGNGDVCVIENGQSDQTHKYFYPASYNFGDNDRMIVVGASNLSDNGSWEGETDIWGNPEGSNYGNNTVDIFAPGEWILSCYPEGCCDDTCQEKKCDEDACKEGAKHHSTGYHHMSGTSMATPFVTGVAALIMSVNPDIGAAEIKDLILGPDRENNENYVDKVYDSNGNNVYSDCVSGGRLNAYKVMQAFHDQGNHFWETWYPSGESQHSHICAVCGYIEYKNHEFEQAQVNQCIFSTCVDCGYYKEQHTQAYVYEQNDAQTHLVTYPCCNTSTEVAHRGAWVNLDTTYHQRTCTDCGYVQLQTHLECWNHLKDMCMACKRKGPISGGSILLIPKEEEIPQ